jgi:hypothetical protein
MVRVLYDIQVSAECLNLGIDLLRYALEAEISLAEELLDLKLEIWAGPVFVVLILDHLCGEIGVDPGVLD